MVKSVIDNYFKPKPKKEQKASWGYAGTSSFDKDENKRVLFEGEINDYHFSLDGNFLKVLIG